MERYFPTQALNFAFKERFEFCFPFPILFFFVLLLGERQFNGLVDVYRKTLASDGIAGLYRGFVISCIGIVIYRGVYFGLYDTAKPLIDLNGGFLVSFGVCYAVTGMYSFCICFGFCLCCLLRTKRKRFSIFARVANVHACCGR